MPWRPKWVPVAQPWRTLDKKGQALATKLWKAGTLRHLLTPSQQTVDARMTEWSLRYAINFAKRIDDPTRLRLGRIFMLDCSRRWGKSALLLKRALEFGATQKGWRMIYMGPEYKELIKIVDIIMPMLVLDCPPGLLGKEHGPDWARGEQTYHFRNTGSRLEIIGLDKNPDGARGPAVDYAFGDEMGFLKNLEYTLRSIVSPQLLGRDHARLELASTPPVSPAHYWSSTLVPQAKNEGAHDKKTIEDADQYSVEEIEDEIHNAGGRRHTTCLRELFCEHVADSNLAIIPEYREMESRIVKAWTAPKWRDCYTVMDPGWKDHTAVLFGYVDFENAKWVIEDEISAPRMNSAAVAEAVKLKESQLWKGVFCVGANQRLRAQPLWRFSDRDKHLQEQLAREHDLLFQFTRKTDLDQHINALRVAIHSGNVIIHPRCTRLRDDLRNGVWKNDARKIFAHSDDAAHFDTVAALMYFIRNADLKRNPAPREEKFVRSTRNENLSGHTEAAALKTSKWSRRGHLYRIR
jgi:hypothetical protein